MPKTVSIGRQDFANRSDLFENLKIWNDKKYRALQAKGIAPERIWKYGFAFEGKNVLIG